MTVQVIAVRLTSEGSRPEHIARVKLVDRMNANVLDWTVAELIKFLERPGAADCLSNAGTRTEVEVVHATPPYIRSKADGTKDDNLLSLPRF